MKPMFFVGIALLASATISLAQQPKAPAQKPKLPDNVEQVKDVEYGKGGGRALTMHILRPKVAPKEAMPVLVWVHGGGWQAGNKNDGIARLAPYAARGYFCATIEYRFSQEAIFPAQIEDCKCAIRFLRAKAKEYNLDPERIGAAGTSAGGHLVALLGTSGNVKELEGDGGADKFSSRVQAVCNICGPTEFFKIVGDSKGATNPVVKMLGGEPAKNKARAESASPITHIAKDAPPFLIIHGDQDKLVPLNQSELLYEALKKAGVPVTLFVAKGQGHILGGPEVAQAMEAFFDKHLKAN